MSDSLALSPSTRVALVDADAARRGKLRQLLVQRGHAILEFDSGTALLADTQRLDAAVVDLGTSETDGLALLQRLRERDVPVVALGVDRGPRAALEAVSRGAHEHLARPAADEQVLAAVGRAVEHQALRRRVRHLERDLEERRGRTPLVGNSQLIRTLLQQIDRVRDSDVPVCIEGETGAGKELTARAIHDRGARRTGPFVALHCASVAAAMQSIELFGQERGGVVYAGSFERAHGGTLFLDEIADLDPAAQAALLQALQDRSVRRVGGSTDIPVDVRLISASRRHLEDEVREHRFREDLFYRIHVYPMKVPALREHREDIPALVDHLMERLRRESGLGAVRVSADAINALVGHAWTGNVRELHNVIHRAMLACDGQEIGGEHLPPSLGSTHGDGAAGPGDKEVVPLRELERREIMKALATTGGSVAQAARRLGIGRATLYRRLSELNLPPPTVALRNALAAAAPGHNILKS
jgi:DNA-binding NtrC family response regulator